MKKEKKITSKQVYDKIRKPLPPLGSTHRDEKTYTRKKKHKKKIINE